MKKKIFVVLLMLVASVMLSGCYFFKGIRSSEVGLQLRDGSSLNAVLYEGRYTHMGLFSKMETVDVSAQTSDWSDPDLVTNSEQPIGLAVSLTYRRMQDVDSIKSAWGTYRREMLNDEALEYQVLSRVPGVAKTVTARYDLAEMLGTAEVTEVAMGREVVTQDLFELLEPELAEVYITLLDVRITNIAVDENYMALLKEKSSAGLQKDVATVMTSTLEEQLKQTRAQTDIDLEEARRQNLVNEELARVYEVSPEFLKIKMMELRVEAFKNAGGVYFIPSDSELSVITNATGELIVPVVE